MNQQKLNPLAHAKKNLWRGAATLTIAHFAIIVGVSGQDQSAAIEVKPEPPATDDAAQANNPLANFTAFNIHNYYIGELTAPDEDANQLWFRYAKPFSIWDTDWIMRASLPVNTFPVGFDDETGLGDLNLFAAFLVDTGNPTLSFGFGPQITMPTATEDALGSEQWSGDS